MTTESRDARRLIESIFANRGWTNDELTAAVDKFAANAATRMRDACVETVKELQRQWGKSSSGGSVSAGFMFDAASEIAAALESLTLGQVEKKQ